MSKLDWETFQETRHMDQIQLLCRVRYTQTGAPRGAARRRDGGRLGERQCGGRAEAVLVRVAPPRAPPRAGQGRAQVSGAFRCDASGRAVAQSGLAPRVGERGSALRRAARLRRIPRPASLSLSLSLSLALSLSLSCLSPSLFSFLSLTLSHHSLPLSRREGVGGAGSLATPFFPQRECPKRPFPPLAREFLCAEIDSCLPTRTYPREMER